MMTMRTIMMMVVIVIVIVIVTSRVLLKLPQLLEILVCNIY